MDVKINIDNLITGIKKDLTLYSNRIAIEMANNFTEELQRETKNSIELFYDHYTPKYYKRHYNFYDSFKRYYRNHGTHISGGVELLVNEMPNVYSDPVDEVFDRVYHGFHGYAGIFDNNVYESFDKFSGTMKKVQHTRYVPPRMIPSPIDRILKKRDELIQNKQIYQKQASEKALQQGGYIYLGRK